MNASGVNATTVTAGRSNIQTQRIRLSVNVGLFADHETIFLGKYEIHIFVVSGIKNILMNKN